MGKISKKAVKEVDKHVDKVQKNSKPDNLSKLNKELNDLNKDLDKLGDWVADIDEDLHELNLKLDKIAKRMGL